MRKTEKTRIEKRLDSIYNQILELDLNDIYANFDEDDILPDLSDMDNDEIAMALESASCAIDFLESDIEDEIEQLKEALKKISEFKKEMENIDQMYNKFVYG